MGTTYKKKFGDKKDGRIIKGDELDTNHYIMPLCWPNRTDNEAFIRETIDITNLSAYLKKKNASSIDIKYSPFMFIVAVIGKTFLNRPKMNRFYRNANLYERYKVSIGFITKKSMTDDGDEALCRVYAEPSDTFESIAVKVQREIDFGRSQVMDKSSDDVRILMKFPHFVGKIVMGFFRFLNSKTTLPDSMTSSDMSFASAIVSNLGSIGLQAGYHHLGNWGTNSFFMTIGKKERKEACDENGAVTCKEFIEIGMTIDERIADGLYFSKTIQLMKQYFNNPELLEKPFIEEND